MIERKTDSDLFSSVVHHIIGQQISTAAQRTIWQRMQTALGEITAESIANATSEELQANGIGLWTAEMKDYLPAAYRRENIGKGIGQ